MPVASDSLVVPAPSHAPPHRRRRTTPIVVATVALLLLPAAFFPLAGDAALYFVSGQKILNEAAAHYRDIVDVKPPLIYYLYAGAAAIFGSDISSFRILDYLLQLATALGLGALVARHADRTTAAVAAILYALTYCAQSYNGTAITESYVGLFAIPMLALQLRRRGAADLLAVGALGGGLFLLKFSLLTPLAVALAAELIVFDQSIARRLRALATIVLGFAAIAALLPLYLSLFDAWSGFAEMNAFLTGYLRESAPGPLVSLRAALTRIPEYLTGEYSLTMLGATAAGAMLALGARSSGAGDQTARTGAAVAAASSGGRPAAGSTGDVPAARASRALPVSDVRDSAPRSTVVGSALLHLATLNFVASLVGVAIEAKYRGFHFSRILPFAAILAAVGFVAIARALREQRPYSSFGRLALALLLPAAIALSPLARYARHAAGTALWVTQGDAGFDRAYANEGLGYTYNELRLVGNHVRSRARAGDELYVSSSVAGMVHAFAGLRPSTPIYHSAFIIAPYAPPAWRQRTRDYIVERQPRFVVLHLRDSMEEMTGVRTTSAAALRELPSVDSLLGAAYDTVVATYRFELYERRRP